MPTQNASAEFKLELPVLCNIGTDCFIQNFADIDPGDDVLGSWCGKASYNGHKGTDFRLRSLLDIHKNIPVIASAAGVVRGFRDGEIDQLVLTASDKARVKNKECGNGVLITHLDGFETQYCHLKRNSIRIKKGQAVSAGDVLGYIGASGFAAFPHLHLTARKNGKWFDPLNGAKPGEECRKPDLGNTFFSAQAFEKLNTPVTVILETGIAGKTVDRSELIIHGAPQALKAADTAIVGWGLVY